MDTLSFASSPQANGDKLAGSSRIDIYRVLKRKGTMRKALGRERNYLKQLAQGESQSNASSFSLTSSPITFHRSQTTYETVSSATGGSLSARSKGRPPPPYDSNRKWRAMSMQTAVRGTPKKHDFYAFTSTRKGGRRASTGQINLHSWEYNNIDITHDIMLEDGKTLYQHLQTVWRLKREKGKKQLKENNVSLNKQLEQITARFKDLAQQFDSEETDEGWSFSPLGSPRSPHPDIEKKTNKHTGKTVITGGKPDKLIEVLIWDDGVEDKDFAQVFFLTHTHWISSSQLFSHMEELYFDQMGSGRNLTQSGLAFAVVKRKKVIRALRLWIDYNYDDFLRDASFMKSVLQFLNKLSGGDAQSKRSAELLKTTLEIKKEEHTTRELLLDFFGGVIDSVGGQHLNHSQKKQKKNKKRWKDPEKIQFVELDPGLLAKQITLFDFKTMDKILVNDLLKMDWDKRRTSTIYPIKERNDMITRWVATEILSTPNEKQRTTVLSNFITLAFQLLEYRNYQSFLNIYFGLKNEHVTQQKRTWSALSTKLKSRWAQLEKMMSVNGLTEFYEKTTLAETPKILPSFLWMRYLILQEATQESQNENAINFTKMRGLGTIIQGIKQSQQDPYAWEEIPELQTYLKMNLHTLDDAQLEKLAAGNEKLHQIGRKGKANQSKIYDIESPPTPHLHSPHHAPTPRAEKEEILVKIQEELEGKWIRPLSKCSIEQDLPRLATKTEIRSHSKLLMSIKARARSRAMKKLLLSFADEIGPKDLPPKIEKCFDDYFPPNDVNIDYSKNTKRFVSEVLGEDSAITSLLKVTCSQGIVSPAWVRLKLFLLSEFPFKDVKSGWNIFVHFDQENVCVVHKKRERSMEQLLDGKPEFEFVWELKMIFSRDMKEFKTSLLYISYLSFGDKENYPQEKQSALKSIMSVWKGASISHKNTKSPKARRYRRAGASPSKRSKSKKKGTRRVSEKKRNTRI